MKPKPHFSQTPSPHSQRGIATILIVVLIGVALTATAMSIMHSIRSTQEKHIAVHAATNAQVGAWAGVEAFRLYLETPEGAALLETANGSELVVGDIALTIETDGHAYGSMGAKEVSITDIGDSYRVNATIINTLEGAQASAAVGVVYDVAKIDTCPGCVTLSAALDFHDDLDVGGQITFIMPEDAKPTINVDGDVEIINVAPISFHALNATGSVSLDSNVRVEEIYSNGDVSLTGDARSEKVTTRGSVTTGGSGGARIIWANGGLTLNGTYRTDAGNTRSTIGVNSSTHGLLKAQGNVTVGSQAKVDEIQTRGDVTINGGVGDPLVTSIIAEGNLSCTPPTWDNYTSISLNGIVNPGCAGPRSLSNDPIPTRVLTNQSNSVTVMAEIQPITIPPMVVDVWTLKQYANYVFEWDSEKSRTKVTVYNIQDIPDGSVFWVGNYEGYYDSTAGAYIPPRKSRLCTAFNQNGFCSAPIVNNLEVCIGHSSDNECLFYEAASKTWEFNGKHALPGVLWFNGNVFLNNGYNYSTVLATGNVKTGGEMRIESVNYAGFDAICKAQGISHTYQSTFEDQYPENLCDMTEQKYLPMDVGNIAIAAGGYDPAGDGAYSGGDIDVGANNQIYGLVLAGGYLFTGGQTEIYGHVSAAVQGDRGLQKNKLGGHTIIDLTKGNDDYLPNRVPDMTDGSACPDCGGPSGSETAGAKVLWSKYL